MIRPFDAWVLARLLANQPLNGELAALSEPWKAIGEHLAGLGAKARQPAWRAVLAARPERDELIKILTTADLMGPAPARVTAVTFATLADVAKIV